MSSTHHVLTQFHIFLSVRFLGRQRSDRGGDNQSGAPRPYVLSLLEIIHMKRLMIGNGAFPEIFALEWVQKHISAFGGDPERVVL